MQYRKTFDAWKAEQPPQVRRDLYEHAWVQRLCEDAWDAATEAASAHPADDGTPVTANWLAERFTNAAVIAGQRQHHGPRGRLTLGVSGGTNCLWMNGELCWVESHANYYGLTRGIFWTMCAALGVPLRAREEG